jgi:hypothetical protein
VFVVTAVGCGGSGTVKVKGVVTLDGQPLSGATVMFVPFEGQGTRPATGATHPDGSFQLTTFKANDGALPGTYHVVVSKPPEGEYGGPMASQSGEKHERRFEMMGKHGERKAAAVTREGRSKLTQEVKKRAPSTVPARYSDPLKTPLKETVPTPGEVKIDLSSKQ